MTDLAPLPRSFYARDVLDVAPECVGKLLVHASPEGLVAGRVVECEAYRGPEDQAAHSHRGRRTARTEAMFGPPGHAYIFRLYGSSWACNLVTGAAGEPQAVLLRALERWLHRPGGATQTEVTALLEPYRGVPTPATEGGAA